MEILILEYNPGIARLLKIAFDSLSKPANLHTVNDGIKAVKFLTKKGEFNTATRPDLLSLDLNLPKKSGQERVDEIRGDRELDDLPVVVMSGTSSKDDILTVYSLKADAFITKPSDIDQYIEIVDSAVNSLFRNTLKKKMTSRRTH